MRNDIRHLSELLALVAAFGAFACQKADATAKREASPPATRSGQTATTPASANAAIQSAVTNELRKDQKVDQRGLLVTVNDGIVTLTGKVDNVLSKKRATRIAECVRGVRVVDNRLEVAPESRPDVDIERDVRKALSYSAATAKLRLHAQVKNAVVTLSGVVGSWQEQQLAERISDDVRGVRFTQNDLTTKRASSRADSAIAGDIKTRLAWDVLVEHDPINVSVTAGKVSLSGTVGSAAEKTRAIDDAWVDAVEGVDASKLAIDSVHPPDKNLQPPVARPDSAIAAAIKEAALYDPRIKSFNFNAEVQSGVVTLTGTVDTVNTKLATESIARNTVGVTEVRNQLVARATQPLADQVLETRLKEAFIFDPIIDAHEVFVTVKDGHVKLSGTVGTFYEKAKAYDVASRLVGVTSIDNALVARDELVPYIYSEFVDPYLPYVEAWYVMGARPNGTDSEIQSRIRAEFSWSPFVHPDRVQVAVVQGKATLTGVVHSFLERQEAARCAREGGAVAIDNELKVI